MPTTIWDALPGAMKRKAAQRRNLRNSSITVSEGNEIEQASSDQCQQLSPRGANATDAVLCASCCAAERGAALAFEVEETVVVIAVQETETPPRAGRVQDFSVHVESPPEDDGHSEGIQDETAQCRGPHERLVRGVADDVEIAQQKLIAVVQLIAAEGVDDRLARARIHKEEEVDGVPPHLFEQPTREEGKVMTLARQTCEIATKK